MTEHITIMSCGHELTIPLIYAASFADEQPIRDQLWTPQAGDVVLDIGASVGAYTLPALARGAFVLAVDVLGEEPLMNLALANGLSGKLILLEQTVVAGPDGYPFWLTDAIHADDESYPEVLNQGKTWTTIDQLVAEYSLPHVNWIKVDTEGAELPIMQGAAQTLAEWHPRLVIEEHSHMPHVREAGSGDALHQGLHELGYSITRHPYHNREIWLCT